MAVGGIAAAAVVVVGPSTGYLKGVAAEEVQPYLLLLPLDLHTLVGDFEEARVLHQLQETLLQVPTSNR